MTSALFTYYTSDIHDFFLDNVNSLIQNSDQQYDTVVICSHVSIPNSISKSLKTTHRVIRVFPDYRGKTGLDNIAAGSRFRIHPFFSTAISYTGADLITVFDSNLFIVNRLPAHNGVNQFYMNHVGQISPALFTIRRNSDLTNVLVNLFVTADFRDMLAVNRFGFAVYNAMALRPYQISESLFILSNPSDEEKIIQPKLIALDFSNLDEKRPIYKKMSELRQALIPEKSALDSLKERVFMSAKSIERSVSALGSFLKFDPSSSYRILFKFTSRSRPALFHRGLSSIFNNSESTNFMVLCSLDVDDPTLPQYHEVIRLFPSENIKVAYGRSKNKIDAINRDINFHTGRWDILVNMSDDMVFTEHGFDMVIRKAFGADLDQFIHFSDSIQFENLCSMTIEGRPYYQRFNYIYNPAYVSLWCDVEAQEVAKTLGKYKYMGNDLAILKHLHPSAGLAELDDQYRKTEDQAVWEADKRTYQIRQASGFKDTAKIPSPIFRPKLSILILTLQDRIDQFAALLEEFTSQINKYDGQCEILWESDNGERTTGEKRNSLLERSTGEYVAFFDDDDWPSPTYVSAVLAAIKTKPDCCSLLGEMTTDGTNPERFEHSIQYTEWRTNPNAAIKYERNPNHLNAIRSSIAKQIKFPHINSGEDREWSAALLKSGLLKTESKIDQVIYHYQYSTLK